MLKSDRKWWQQPAPVVRFGLATLLLMASPPLATVAAAQTTPANFVWEEFGDRIGKADKVSPLGPDLFGDTVRLANGELGFEVTDITLPGNNALPVQVTRTYQVKSRKAFLPEAMLADWQINVPNISGTFGPDWGMGAGTATSARCTSTWLPEAPFRFNPRDFWNGLEVAIPGGGGEMLRTLPETTQPQNGGSHPWTTSGQIFFSCLPTIKNGQGEGFLATTPDGTRYWFDWLAQTIEPSLKQEMPWPADDTSPPPPQIFMQRRLNHLLATKVEDRFGNTVEYQYANAWNAAPKLTAIQANDGRRLTITYNGQNVTSISDGNRQWRYEYNDLPTHRGLSAVLLPDGSRWTIDFRDFTRAELRHANKIPVGELVRTCTENEIPTPYPAEFMVGTMVHPAGAVGSFKVTSMEHGRSHVPLNCLGYDYTPGFGNNTNDDLNAYTISGYSLTLIEKNISGPGVPTLRWQYTYAPSISIYRHPGQSEINPICTLGSAAACAAPPCTSEECAQSSVTTVAGPGGEWVRYSHGSTYHYNEGKLLKVEVGAGPSDIHRTTSYRYDLTASGQAYPARYGTSVKFLAAGWPSEHHRPQLESHVNQQGAVFSSVSSEFDYFARPRQVARYSTLGFARTEGYSYHDNLARWVISQRQSVTCLAPASCAGQVIASVVFDPPTDLPAQFHAFGALQQTLTFHPNGSVATASDARNGSGVNTTMSFLEWKRGIPQAVHYGDGSIELATVSDAGWILQYSDANGFTRSYAYDAMGRLQRTDQPSDDTVAWNATTARFEAVPNEEHGLPAGHWRGTSQTGNQLRQVFYDAFWRPVITVEEDVSNPQVTQRWVANRYDELGRLAFTSYPRNPYFEGNISYTDTSLQGTRTTFDVLGRPIQVQQDSELGILTTRYEYLAGFQTRVTEPNGQQTTTRFMALDEPDTGLPVAMDEPGGVTTTIERDAHGKPLEITRSGGVQ